MSKPMNVMRIANVKLIGRSSLVASCDVAMASGLIPRDVLLFNSHDKSWALPGSRPLLEEGGKQMIDANGKRRWAPLIGFTSRDVSSRWSEQVVVAVHEQHPGVLSS